MAAKLFIVLQVLFILTNVNAEDDLKDVIQEIFSVNSDQGDFISTVRPVEKPTLLNATSGAVCSLGEQCVREYSCSNGQVKMFGDKTVFNVRLLDDDEVKECPFLSKCCAIEDIVTKPIIRPTETAQGCGVRNVNGVGFGIEGAVHKSAQFGEFPWMLAILKGTTDFAQKRDIYQCGGTLIHPQVVLTAAHCVYGHSPIAFAVNAGEWESNTKNDIYPPQNRDVIDMAIHPDYNDHNLINDVALLFLNSPFELSPHINTICLPPGGFNFDFSKCYATGWGKDKFQNGHYQNILKKIELPVVPNYVCQDNLRQTRLGHFFQLHNTFLCAGGELGIDTCQGDGGSPLACPIESEVNRYYVAGLVAWGIECGKKDVPGVYVNVSQFRKWIDEELSKRRLAIADYKPR